MKLIEKEEIYAVVESVTNALGKPLDRGSYEVKDRKVPHIPEKLPNNKRAIYMFCYNGIFLKIGKVGSSSSKDRFYNHHYRYNGAKSTLAKSIINDENVKIDNVNERNIGEWIKSNCQRIDIIIDDKIDIFTLNLIEAALQFKYKPIYEGFKSQRKSKEGFWWKA